MPFCAAEADFGAEPFDESVFLAGAEAGVAPFAEGGELLLAEDPDGSASFFVPLAAGAFPLGAAAADEAAGAAVAGAGALAGAAFLAPLAAGAGFFSSSFPVVYPKADDSQSDMISPRRIHASPAREHPPLIPAPDPRSIPWQKLNAGRPSVTGPSAELRCWPWLRWSAPLGLDA